MQATSSSWLGRLPELPASGAAEAAHARRLRLPTVPACGVTGREFATEGTLEGWNQLLCREFRLAEALP